MNGFTGASEALLEESDYEVDSEGKRRRKLDVLIALVGSRKGST